MLEIDLASADELPFVLNSYTNTQAQHYRGPRPAIRAWLRSNLLGQLERPEVCAWVARDQGVALGCLVAAQNESGLPNLLHLYTKASFRRSGVATALLRETVGSELDYSCRAFPVGRKWADRIGARYVGDLHGAHYAGSTGLHQRRGNGS